MTEEDKMKVRFLVWDGKEILKLEAGKLEEFFIGEYVNMELLDLWYDKPKERRNYSGKFIHSNDSRMKPFVWDYMPIQTLNPEFLLQLTLEGYL